MHEGTSKERKRTLHAALRLSFLLKGLFMHLLGLARLKKLS